MLTKAGNAKKVIGIAEDKEKIQLAIIENYKYGSIEENKLKEKLNEYNLNIESITGENPIVIIFKDGKVYEVDKNGLVNYIGIKTSYTDKEPILNSSGAIWNTEYKQKVTRIITKNYIAEPDNIIEKWDVSKKGDKSVIAFITDDGNGGYNAFIEANGNIKVTSAGWLFNGFINAKSIDCSALDTSNCTLFASMFDRCTNLIDLNIGNLNTDSATQMYSMFYGCTKLKNIDLSNFNTENVSSFSKMFMECKDLEYLNVSSFNTSNATKMDNMFSQCESLKEINVSNFDTKNVTSMASMFTQCKILKKINLTNFDTNSVTSMANMFSYCANLKELKLNPDIFITKKVTSMYMMFWGCSDLENLDIRSLETDSVESTSTLFRNCNNLKELNISKLKIKGESSMILYESNQLTKITTNQETANWIKEKYPKYSDIITVVD